MNKIFALLLSLLLLLSLAACGAEEDARPAENEPPEADSGELWAPFDYTTDERVTVDLDALADDGTKVCTCYHSVPSIAAVGEVNAAQQASVDAFNEAMREVLDGSRILYESLCEMALSDYEYRLATGLGWDGFYADELTYTLYCTPYAIAVDFFGYTNSGGAYPNAGNVCYLFDLEAGKMVSIDDIADGDAFRNAIAEEIILYVEDNGLQEGYYEDYEATVRSQNEAQYFFRENELTVYFSDYTLAPHAAGYPTFHISGHLFSPLLNERGLRLLGYGE